MGTAAEEANKHSKNQLSSFLFVPGASFQKILYSLPFLSLSVFVLVVLHVFVIVFDFHDIFPKFRQDPALPVASGEKAIQPEFQGIQEGGSIGDRYQ